MSNRTITIKRRQSIYDIAVQYCGNVSAASQIAQLNNVPVHDEVAGGTLLIVPEELDKDIVLKYRLNNVEPATGNVDGYVPDGIDYMAIEIDFTVS